MIVYRLSFNQCVLLVSHLIVAFSESNHSAAGPRRTEPKRAFLRSSYTVWMLFSFVVGLLPNEKLIFFSVKRMNAVGSSLESVPINFSNAKSGYASVRHFLFNKFSCSNFVQFCALCTTIIYSSCFNLNLLLCLSSNHVILL